MNLKELLEKWLGRQGGAERANYQMFLTELCQALDLAAPDPKGAGIGGYQFEAPVKSQAALGKKGTGRIDLYKRGCFILEAKQSQVKPGEAQPEDPPDPPPQPIHDLFGNPVGYEAPKRGAPRYDRLMADARLQAERYALALPADHEAPPFLIVADIGRSFEIYFDWSGNGRGYGFFPNQQTYRIGLEDLASGDEIQPLKMTARDILRAIWTAPASIDPRLRSAEVTRDIAVRLSNVARQLEKDQRAAHKLRSEGELSLGIEATSLFLMRLLFCMFAEDVELLPKKSFQRFLEDARDRSPQFWKSGLADLWSRMNSPDEANRYWSFGDAIVRYFNGNLFANAQVYDLPPEHKGELLIAASKDWRSVEPAIFGTLLEQVLVDVERSKLGAHYTPRPYVERLVNAVVMDVIRPEWEDVREQARARFEAGETELALAGIRGFHERLIALKILDPACGTGNFLYVAMEQLLRLEGEAIQLAAEFGARIAPAVHPNQFLGLELNPRAAVIAELVLWIGWLRHRLANYPDSIGEPVLPPLSNINEGTHGGFDAVLVRTATGEPDTENPRRPPWPEADFILGNPPFIGGKDIRDRLGSDYAEALWKANPRVPKSADFVMQWWDRAADILTRPGTRLKRLGFVTTNSITQVFSRRVIEHWLNASPPSEGGDKGVGSGAAGSMPDAELRSAPTHAESGSSPDEPGFQHPSLSGRGALSLILAIPDHPWTRASPDAAAVRIAMTVAEAGEHDGCLIEIVGERKLDTDEPELDEVRAIGRINADLTIGTDATKLVPLKANEGICSPGVKLHGAGFIVSPAKARELGLGTREGLDRHIREYRNGRDLLQRPRGVMVIDLFGLSEREARERFPELYDHLLKTVKPERDNNRRESYKRNWWIFGEPRSEWRSASAGLLRFIATTETSKHRIFQFLDASVLPDNMIVAVASEDAFHLGVLQSSLHQQWALSVGGWLGFGNDNRYNKSKVFDPFPFPDAPSDQRERIGRIAEDLDSTCRAALAGNDKLTMTGLYNLVEAVRAAYPSPLEGEGGAPSGAEGEGATGRGATPPHPPTPVRAGTGPSLSRKGTGAVDADLERRIVQSRARIVAKLHDDLDAAVADAYGWEWPLAPGEIVARLVALNAARAAEEKAGTVRWLRPDYQQPRFG